MPPWVRASALERAQLCPSSAALPQDDRPGEAAAWGTMVHHWAATGEVVASPTYPGHAGGLRRRLSLFGGPRLLRERLWPGEGRHEVAVAVDCTRFGRAAEYHGPKEGVAAWRDSLGDEWLAGEADWVSEVVGTPWVEDLKTGRFPPSPESPQLRAYGLGVWAISESNAPSMTLSILHWPRYPATGAPRRLPVATVTTDDQLRFYRHLGTLRDRVMALRGDPNRARRAARPGPHCTYCPSLRYCPKGRGEKLK